MIAMGLFGENTNYVNHINNDNDSNNNNDMVSKGVIAMCLFADITINYDKKELKCSGAQDNLEDYTTINGLFHGGGFYLLGVQVIGHTIYVLQSS